MPEHTKAPWILTDENNDNRFTVVRRAYPSSEMRDIQCGNYEDAWLVAAAPELLEALEKLTDHLKGNMSVPSYVYRAINKAKGYPQ